MARPEASFYARLDALQDSLSHNEDDDSLRTKTKPERCSWSSRSAAFMPLHCGNVGVVGSSKASPYSVNAKRHECRAPAAGACSFTRVGACLTESFRMNAALRQRMRAVLRWW